MWRVADLMAASRVFLLRRLGLGLGLDLNPRALSSTPTSTSNTKTNFDPLASASASASASDASETESLSSRLLRLRFPQRSATAALQSWLSVSQSQGREAPPSPAQFRQAIRDLNRCGRYKHALEVSEWMKLHLQPHLSGYDYGIHINLITKVFGLNAAQDFFNSLPCKPLEAYTALLHHFASSKSVHKAETLFHQMKTENLLSDALPFNEIMTLYVSLREPHKVFPLVTHMKTLKLPFDLYTYNLWLSAYGAILDFQGLTSVLSEMEHDPNCDHQWHLYRKLVQVYVDVGRFEGVQSAMKLIETDTKVTVSEWITYDLLVILHASLGNRGTIKEMWRCMRMSPGKMTYRNYICAISSLLVAGELDEAGQVVDQWKESKDPEFDFTSCCSLFDALLKVDLIEIAQSFRQLMQDKSYEIKTST